MKKNWPDRVPRDEQPRRVDLANLRMPGTALRKLQIVLMPAAAVLLVVLLFISSASFIPDWPADPVDSTEQPTSTTIKFTSFESDYTQNQLSRDHSFDFYLNQVAVEIHTPTLAPTLSPTPTSSPTPSPYPLIYDAAGIPQEGMPIADFLSDGSTWYISSSKVNVRQLPATSSDIVARLVMGDAVTRVSYGLHWSCVKTADGLTGYALTSLMSAQFVARPTPSPTPTPKPTKAPTPTPAPTKVPVNPGSVLTDEQKAQIVELARSCLGVKYVYGSESMDGFDCSGLTTYIYLELFGINNLPRSARGQATAGKAVPLDSIEIGDIICFDWSGNDGICDHVGIYIGGGQYIHASYTKGYVLEATLKPSFPVVSVRRIIY
jgi:cell wall-associated NlpC family hydrolase